MVIAAPERSSHQRGRRPVPERLRARRVRLPFQRIHLAAAPRRAKGHPSAQNLVTPLPRRAMLL